MPATSSSMTSLLVGEWWSGEAVLGGPHTPPCASKRKKELPWLVSGWDHMSPPWCMTVCVICGRSVSALLDDELFGDIDWPAPSPGLIPIQHLWDIMYRRIHHHHVPTETVQELTDVLIQVWEEVPQDAIRHKEDWAIWPVMSCDLIFSRWFLIQYWNISCMEIWEVSFRCSLQFFFFILFFCSSRMQERDTWLPNTLLCSKMSLTWVIILVPFTLDAGYSLLLHLTPSPDLLHHLFSGQPGILDILQRLKDKGPLSTNKAGLCTLPEWELKMFLCGWKRESGVQDRNFNFNFQWTAVVIIAPFVLALMKSDPFPAVLLSNVCLTWDDFNILFMKHVYVTHQWRVLESGHFWSPFHVILRETCGMEVFYSFAWVALE